MSQQKKQSKKLYPIIPIHLPYSSISLIPNPTQTTIENDVPLSSLSPFANYLTRFIRALAAKNSIHTSQQTDEILALLQDPQTKIETRKLKKTAYTYRHIPQKVRESISAKRPTSLGTSCGFAEYGLIRIYLFDEEDYGRKLGFEKGDMVLDTRTRIPPQNAPLTAKNRTPKRKPWEEEESEVAVGFILPVESHCVLDKMAASLDDFVQISLMPLSCVSVGRRVESNRAGGLEAFPRWNGVVVSPEILEALSEPSGEIYRRLEEKWGIRLEVERAKVCPEVVENSGMILLTRIWW
jgi:hypothetical protein